MNLRTFVGRCSRRPKTVIASALILLGLMCSAGTAAAQLTSTNLFVPTNSTFRFLRGTNEASSPTNAWRFRSFDDSSWPLAQAPFHYGTNTVGGDDNLVNGTILPDMRSNYTCIFLRKEFVVPPGTIITGVRYRLFYDDGFVIWLNGARSRVLLAPSEPSYTNTALASREAITSFFDGDAGSHTNIVEGTNVLCIQVFNFGSAADPFVDFRVDPEMYLVVAQAPAITSVGPPPGNVTNFAQIAVEFNHAVQNVDASDLHFNGQPADRVSGGGSSYVFTKIAAAGAMAVTWNASHGITNALGIPFDASAIQWNYQNTVVPLAIQSVSPAPGAAVSTLTSAVVTFNAVVTGIEPADFLINGTAADSVTGAGQTWTFNFKEPPAGLVEFSWDGSHAIYDAAGRRFDNTAPGAVWTATLNDVVAPVVSSTLPSPGAVVGSLTNIEVTFREPVSGVDASDLRVNGVAATGAIGSGAGPYLFTFNQPGAGAVSIAWAGSHGITDSAGNPFSGTGWNYTLNPAATPNVVINEIMAENLNGLVDEDGDTSDWIELYNAGAAPVSLLGWSLSDDPTVPGRWMFPAVTIGAGEYILVFASAKDRPRVSPGTNHTSFTLAPNGYLGLFNADLPRRAVSEFVPEYPVQRGDIAWGRTATNTYVYFGSATPKAANSSVTNYAGVTEPPNASVNSGLFDRSFNLVLSSSTPGASIYYTLDGNVPTAANGTLYTGPLTIAGSAGNGAIPVRAIALKPGLLPSSTITRTYVFPQHVITQPITPAGYPSTWISGGGKLSTSGDYEMDPQVLNAGTNAQIVINALRELPVVSLVSSVDNFFAPTTGVYTARIKQGNQKAANVQMWRENGEHVFNVDCGFEIQGGTSPTDTGGDWKEKKLSMRLIFRGDFGTPKLKAKLFDDSPVDEFDTLILDAGMNFWWTHMTDGDQRNRAKFITDQFTADLMNHAGMVAMHGKYVHLFLNGLYWGVYDLHERMDESAAASYLGGKKEEWDILKHRGDTTGLQNGTVTNFTALMGIARSGIASNSVYERVKQHLDVPWFIDYMLVNFWNGNTDWPHQNWYSWGHSRVPGSPGWRFVSWDAEHTVRQWDFNFLANGNLNTANSPGELFRLLTNNFEFRVQFWDRVQKLMMTPGGTLYTTPGTAVFWSPTNQAVSVPATLYRKRVDEIWNSIVSESARWGDVATARANQPYTRELEYIRELNALFTITNIAAQTPNFFPLRGSNVLAQLRGAFLYPNVGAPVFSQNGGPAVPGASITMSASNTIYFTTNGADPRVYGTGFIAPTASQYVGPLSIGGTMTVKARALNGTNWSALNEAVFNVAQLTIPLRITELHYNPVGGSAYEFFELQNVGAVPIDLGGFYFDGVEFLFPAGTMIAPGARMVLANNSNPALWAGRYPGATVSGWYNGALNNIGERITLFDRFDNIVLTVDYSNTGGWPARADGGGSSLELIDPNGDLDSPANWRASTVLHGTPGVAGTVPPPVVVLNEVMADNTHSITNGGTLPDWIELYNSASSPMDLSGWSLSDSANPRAFVFPASTTIAAGGYLLVWCDSAFAAPGLHTGFALGRAGDNVYLYDPQTNRVDAISFGAQLSDFTLGRINGDWQLTVPTPNAPNTAAALAPASSLVINEWLANSPSGGSDWIEVFNTSASAPVALQNLYVGAGAAMFQIRAHSFVAPLGHAQLFADEQPGANHLDVQLSAAGETVSLYDSAGVLINRVSFTNQLESVTQGRLPDGSATISSFPGSASPAAANYLLAYSGPVINELLALNQGVVSSPFGSSADFLEIVNTASTNFDLGGMSVSDDAGSPRKFTFAPGTTLIPGSNLVLWCDSAARVSSNGVLNAGFALAGSGGAVYLFNKSAQLVQTIEYGVQAANLSIGQNGGVWRLLASPSPGANNTAPAVLGSPANLRLNEWMAQPVNGDDWIELFNRDAAPVELSGLYLSDTPSIAGQANTRIAPLSFIAGNGWATFVADGSLGAGPDHVDFSISADGDSLVLLSTNLALIDTVTFGVQTAGVSEGRLPDGAPATVRFPTTATPDASNYLPLDDVFINEILTHTDAPLEDAVEIYNASGNALSIAGWWLSNSDRPLQKHVIASGVSVPAGGFRVIYENAFNPLGTGAGTNFTLNSARGGTVYLSQVTNGQPTGYRAQVTFGAAENGVSIGRQATSIGSDFTAMAQRTFGVDNPSTVTQFRTGNGLPNSYAKIGPIIINEIHYHPVPSAGTSGAEVDTEEYIELHNVTASTVAMFDTAHPTNTWSIDGGIAYRFPPNTTIPPHGYIVLANFSPTNAALLASFRSKYGSNGTVMGPFSGRLSNGGESVELYKPDAPQTAPSADAGYIPQILVDRVAYASVAPWAPAADGGGASLQRLTPALYGNDPANWKAEAPTAGRTNSAAGGSLPVITGQPGDQNVIAGATATFTVAATGTPPLTYQWQHNGTNIAGATASTYMVPNAGAQHVGDYRVVVGNGFGGVVSDTAFLRVLVSPAISAQPQSQTVVAGTNVNLSVAAIGSEPLFYHWRFNNTALPGQNSPQLSLFSITPSQAGAYTVVVSNFVGAVTSTVATVVVIVPPAITGDPDDAVASIGQSVQFAVSATGTAPLSYQWRRNGQPIGGANGPILNLNSVQAGDEGSYDVVVSNAGGSAISDAAMLVVNVGPILGAPHPLGTNGFRFTLTGASNKSYAIEFTSTLSSWTNLGTVTLTNTSAVITDPSATNAQFRYYRARQLP